MRRKVRRLILVLLVPLAAVALMKGGGGCQKSVEDTTIDTETMAKKNPQAEPPQIHFPHRTDDAGLNQFIESGLQTCATGDYDAFRALFGTAFSPPSPADFERIWKGVQSVEVISVHPGNTDPPEYYVHAVVRLRAPDRRDREKRDVVVAISREADEWRMAQAPNDVIRKVLVVDSQPASEPSPGGDEP